MSGEVLELQLPLSEEIARELKLGQIVTVSGMIFTGRSRFHIRAVEQDLFPPIDYEAINGFFTSAPLCGKAKAAGKSSASSPLRVSVLNATVVTSCASSDSVH